MTSQNLWLRDDRHFVGITWHKCVELRSEDLWCYLNKIHSVFYENVCMITSLSVFQQHHSGKHF